MVGAAAVHVRTGVALFRGAGVLGEAGEVTLLKSAELLSVSEQPAPSLKIAVVALMAGAAAPSEKFAVP